MNRYVVTTLVLMGCPQPQPPPPCADGGTGDADAGVHWLKSRVQVPEGARSVQNLAIENGGGLFDGPGPFRFVVSTGGVCPAVTTHVGEVLERALRVTQLVRFPDTPPMDTSGIGLDVENLTDDILSVEIESSRSEVSVGSGAALIGPRSIGSVTLFFSPEFVGEVQGSISVRLGNELQAIVRVMGYGGGPNVVADAVDGGLVAFVAAGRPDGRPLRLRNRALSNEADRGNWVFMGYTVEPDECKPLISLLKAPQVLAPGSEFEAVIGITPTLGGQYQCQLSLAGQLRPIRASISWHASTVPPCLLSQVTSVVYLDAGSGTFRMTNDRFDSCFLSWPRFEPEADGVVVVDWWTYELRPDETLEIPLLSSDGGEFVLNLSDPVAHTLRIPVR